MRKIFLIFFLLPLIAGCDTVSNDKPNLKAHLEFKMCIINDSDTCTDNEIIDNSGVKDITVEKISKTVNNEKKTIYHVSCHIKSLGIFRKIINKKNYKKTCGIFINNRLILKGRLMVDKPTANGILVKAVDNIDDLKSIIGFKAYNVYKYYWDKL